MRHIVKYAEHGTDCGHEGCPHPKTSWCGVELAETDDRFHGVDHVLRHIAAPMIRAEPCDPCMTAIFSAFLDGVSDAAVAAALGSDPDFH